MRPPLTRTRARPAPGTANGPVHCLRWPALAPEQRASTLPPHSPAQGHADPTQYVVGYMSDASSFAYIFLLQFLVLIAFTNQIHRAAHTPASQCVGRK